MTNFVHNVGKIQTINPISHAIKTFCQLLYQCRFEEKTSNNKFVSHLLAFSLNTENNIYEGHITTTN